MKRPPYLNKLATAAIIPLVAVGFFVALQGAGSSEPGKTFVPEGELILANLRDESLTFFDFQHGERVDVALAGPPHEMLKVDGNLFVTMGRKDLVAEVDIASRTVERYLVLDGGPHGLATDGQNLYVSLDDANEIVVLDLGTLAESGRIETGATPHIIERYGSTIFVANSGDGTVSATGGETTVTVPTGSVPESLAVAGPSALAVANSADDTLSLLALPGMSPVADYAIGGRPVRVVPFGDLLLIARSRFGDLAVLDPVSGELRAAVGIGQLTDGICAAPSGAWVAVAANGDNRLRIIDTERWRRSMDYDTSDGPGSCLWLGDD